MLQNSNIPITLTTEQKSMSIENQSQSTKDTINTRKFINTTPHSCFWDSLEEDRNEQTKEERSRACILKLTDKKY